MRITIKVDSLADAELLRDAIVAHRYATTKTGSVTDGTGPRVVCEGGAAWGFTTDPLDLASAAKMLDSLQPNEQAASAA